jgi:hypothetical protein
LLCEHPVGFCQSSSFLSRNARDRVSTVRQSFYGELSMFYCSLGYNRVASNDDSSIMHHRHNDFSFILPVGDPVDTFSDDEEEVTELKSLLFPEEFRREMKQLHALVYRTHLSPPLASTHFLTKRRRSVAYQGEMRRQRMVFLNFCRTLSASCSSVTSGALDLPIQYSSSPSR